MGFVVSLGSFAFGKIFIRRVGFLIFLRLIEFEKFGKILSLFFGGSLDKVVRSGFGYFFERIKMLRWLFLEAETLECLPEFGLTELSIDLIALKPEPSLFEKKLLYFVPLQHNNSAPSKVNFLSNYIDSDIFTFTLCNKIPKNEIS